MTRQPNRKDRALYVLMLMGLGILYVAIIIQSYIAIDSQARESTSQH